MKEPSYGSKPGYSLKIRSEGGLSMLPGGDASPLREMVSRSLGLLQPGKALETRHRIGEHLLCGPDYRLVCAMAEDVGMTPDAVLKALEDYSPEGNEMRTNIVEGQFLSLVIRTEVPISKFPSIDGLVIKHLSVDCLALCELDLPNVVTLTTLLCRQNQLTELNLSTVPNLTLLDCNQNQLTELNLSTVPNLTLLDCNQNQLTELDLSGVPNLMALSCRQNHLTELDISAVPHLTRLYCGQNELTDLNLSTVPNLTRLSCGQNQLTELNLSAVPNLTRLSCWQNELTELDIRRLFCLTELTFDEDLATLIQRRDQHF